MAKLPGRVLIRNFGPIKSAEVNFADLTVLVGPQATGKSLFLQLVKLLVDFGPIYREMRRFSLDWRDEREFLQLFFGEGLGGLYLANATDDDLGTTIEVDGTKHDLLQRIRPKKKLAEKERIFLIPAQRVLTLRDGVTHPFTDYRSGDPFVVREFSEKLHQLVQMEFAHASKLFPATKRLKAGLRRLVSDRIFAGWELKPDTHQMQRRLVLGRDDGVPLPYMVWSAGQREFVPLLLGLYWLMPAGSTSKRKNYEWVMIEEPEMGLHPSATVAVMALLMELLGRRYRVSISTHSPHVLDIIWCLRQIKERGGGEKYVRELFDLKATNPEKKLASELLNKDYQVYYFRPDGQVQDISDLDPGSSSAAIAGWGGLIEFSGRVCEIVGKLPASADKQDTVEGDDDISGSTSRSTSGGTAEPSTGASSSGDL